MAGKEGEADAASDITETDVLKAIVRRETLALQAEGPAKDAAARESVLKQVALIARAQTLIATAELTQARLADHSRKRRAEQASAAVLSGPDSESGGMKTIDEMEGEELERTLAELERKMAVAAVELGIQRGGRGPEDRGAAGPQAPASGVRGAGGADLAGAPSVQGSDAAA